MFSPKRRTELLQQLGGRIRQARKARGLTQAELAEVADLSTHFISMVEHGEVSPSLPTLARLAAALNLSLSSIFDFDRSYTPSPQELAIHQLIRAAWHLRSEDILLLTRFLKNLSVPTLKKK
jgi:transcriptional regulator with XRE-family HTH domain